MYIMKKISLLINGAVIENADEAVYAQNIYTTKTIT